MAFWTDLHRVNAGRQASPTMTRVRRQRQPRAAEGSSSGTRAGPNPGFPRRVAASSVNTVRPDRAQRSPGECLTRFQARRLNTVHTAITRRCRMRRGPRGDRRVPAAAGAGLRAGRSVRRSARSEAAASKRVRARRSASSGR
jgi:hypothetical protein